MPPQAISISIAIAIAIPVVNDFKSALMEHINAAFIIMQQQS